MAVAMLSAITNKPVKKDIAMTGSKTLRAELDAHQMNLPIYWGNRNWSTLLESAMREIVSCSPECYTNVAVALTKREEHPIRCTRAYAITLSWRMR